MKRSEINLFLGNAIDFFESNYFSLPPFADWSFDMWQQRGQEADEIRRCQLGWDVTDFSTGNFASCGLTLFTLRNGTGNDAGYSRPYAEKIMMVREKQLTPLHFHARKTEDIINRGGPKATGDLVVQLYPSTDDCRTADVPVAVACDGIQRQVQPGDTIVLRAGESITLPPRIYHSFHAIHGDALIGEVSSVNDDTVDNHFHLPQLRFPAIEEDEPPLRLLCTEYP